MAILSTPWQVGVATVPCFSEVMVDQRGAFCGQPGSQGQCLLCQVQPWESLPSGLWVGRSVKSVYDVVCRGWCVCVIMYDGVWRGWWVWSCMMWCVGGDMVCVWSCMMCVGDDMIWCVCDHVWCGVKGVIWCVFHSFVCCMLCRLWCVWCEWEVEYDVCVCVCDMLY